MVFDPQRNPLRRLAERAPAPAESVRTTFRLPPRAADALTWLTAQLRSTQKDVLAGLPDIVEDLRGTTLWDTLATVAGAPSSLAAAPPAYGWRVSQAPSLSFDSMPSVRPLAGPSLSTLATREADEPGERSTYVLPKEALERLTALSESLGVARDEVVSRALVALRAAVEVRQAGRPAVINVLRAHVAELEGGVGSAAEEAVALPPHDPIRVNLERAYQHLVDARKALEVEPSDGPSNQP